MAKNKNLHEMMITKLQALYDVESELVENLPKMAEAATDDELKTAIEEHVEETKEQARRLENIFSLLKEEPRKLKVEAIRGLIKDSEWMLKNTEEGDSKDLAIISGARHVEHYEMSSYMAAQEWAEMMGHEEVAALLEETLEEEEAAEEKLAGLGTQIAERINEDAEKDEDEEEEEEEEEE